MTQNIINGKKKGFTLLELLLVIGIIAALVGLAVPYYQDYVDQSEYSIMRANLHLIRKSLMEYKSDVGSYPASLNTMVPRYLMYLPEDPSNATGSWGYRPLLNGASFTLDAVYMKLIE